MSGFIGGSLQKGLQCSVRTMQSCALVKTLALIVTQAVLDSAEQCCHDSNSALPGLRLVSWCFESCPAAQLHVPASDS